MLQRTRTVRNMKLRLGWIAGLCLGLAAFSAEEATPDKTRAERWFKMSAREFSELPEARRPLDFENLDEDLLSAAIFHETNQRRADKKLPPLKPHAKARQAAAMQARVMAAKGFVGHENPDSPEKREMDDRLRLLGLEPAFAAENVAMAYAVQYEPGRPLYTDTVNGKTVYRYEVDGPPLEKHTYMTVAESLLNQWMKSPAHRENILSKRSEYLGCSGFLGVKQSGFETVYSTQVFFTPL